MAVATGAGSLKDAALSTRSGDGRRTVKCDEDCIDEFFLESCSLAATLAAANSLLSAADSLLLQLLLLPSPGLRIDIWWRSRVLGPSASSMGERRLVGDSCSASFGGLRFCTCLKGEGRGVYPERDGGDTMPLVR